MFVNCLSYLEPGTGVHRRYDVVVWNKLRCTLQPRCTARLPVSPSWLSTSSYLQVTLTSKDLHLYLNVGMSNPQPGKRSKTSRLLRPFKSLFSRCYCHSPSPSHQGVQSVTSHIAATSISASATNSATSAPQVNPQGTEYTAILELSTTSSGPLTWEHRMKEWGSTAYEGLKTAIQGIYDCSGSFPPLQVTAGVLLMISKVVDVRGSI